MYVCIHSSFCMNMFRLTFARPVLCWLEITPDQGLLIDLFLQEIDYGMVSTSGPATSASSQMVLDRPLSSTASHSNSAHTNTSELSSSGDTSSASSQKIIDENHQMTPNKHVKRLAGVDPVLEQRSRSPQSSYSAKLANKQTNNSVYYYSDTLRKEDKVNTRVMLHDKKTAQGSTLVWIPLFNTKQNSFWNKPFSSQKVSISGWFEGKSCVKDLSEASFTGCSKIKLDWVEHSVLLINPFFGYKALSRNMVEPFLV